MNHSIETENLSLWYGDFQALIDVTVKIPDGQITSLIGPSGCGKTTLLRCFNRVNERYGNVTTEGKIEILGKNIYDSDVSLPELRKAVGMVFQRPNPLPISVYENILFGLRIHSPMRSITRTESDQIVEEALTSVFLWEDLKDKLKARATSLQLEQQQKLCIARLLPLKPKIILMDEPCSALDAKGTLAVEELMEVLAGTYTFLIVTHNMAQARRVSKECIFMFLGELIEHRETQALFEDPKHEKTADYVQMRYGSVNVYIILMVALHKQQFQHNWKPWSPCSIGSMNLYKKPSHHEFRHYSRRAKTENRFAEHRLYYTGSCVCWSMA